MESVLSLEVHAKLCCPGMRSGVTPGWRERRAALDLHSAHSFRDVERQLVLEAWKEGTALQ